MLSPRWVLRVHEWVTVYSVVTSALRARGRRRRDRRGRTGRIVAIVRRLGGGEGLRWWGWVSNKWIGRDQGRIAAIKCLDGPFGVEDSRTDFGSHELRVRLSARFQSAVPPSFFETSQCTTYILRLASTKISCFYGEEIQCWSSFCSSQL